LCSVGEVAIPRTESRSPRRSAAFARLLAGGAGERVERVGDLVGQGCNIVFHGGYILLQAFIGGFIRHVSHSEFSVRTRHQKLPETELV